MISHQSSQTKSEKHPEAIRIIFLSSSDTVRGISAKWIWEGRTLEPMYESDLPSFCRFVGHLCSRSNCELITLSLALANREA